MLPDQQSRLPHISITYRCLECKSDDINIEVLFNWRSQRVVRFLKATVDGNKCYCNNCHRQTSFGWLDKS